MPSLLPSLSVVRPKVPVLSLDVLALVGDALLPKELIGRPAIPSAGLVVQDDPLHWMSSLFMGTGALYG